MTTMADLLSTYTTQSQMNSFFIDKMGIINVKSYGAVGNGVADDTAAIQAAIDAMEAAGGGIVFLPAGIYKVTVELTITHGCIITGCGTHSTIIHPATATQNTFHVQTDHAVFISDLMIYSSDGEKTGGAGIYIEGATAATENKGTKIERVQMSRQYNGIEISAAAEYFINKCRISEIYNYGIIVANIVDPDDGDGKITDNFIGGYDSNSEVGILQYSSGGLKLIGNKILGFKKGIRLAINSTTSILLMTGNSLENQTTTCIELVVATGVTFESVTITGNQFAPLGSIAITIIGVNNVSITGNIIETNPAGGGVAVQVSGSSNGIIDGNTIVGNGATAGAVSFSATALGWRFGKNNILTGITQIAYNLSASSFVEFTGAAAPTVGTYAVGDACWNTAPTAGGTIGWVCTTVGAPGTWKTFGAIAG